MEAAFVRLEHDTHSPVAVEGESYYATPRRRLEETMKDINELCANHARLAHELDSSLHSLEMLAEIVWIPTIVYLHFQPKF